MDSCAYVRALAGHAHGHKVYQTTLACVPIFIFPICRSSTRR